MTARPCRHWGALPPPAQELPTRTAAPPRQPGCVSHPHSSALPGQGQLHHQHSHFLSSSWQQMAKSLRCTGQGFGNKLCWLDQGLHPSPALFPFLPRLFFSPRGAKATCFCSRRTGDPPGVIKHSHHPSRSICQKDLLSSSLSEHSDF